MNSKFMQLKKKKRWNTSYIISFTSELVPIMAGSTLQALKTNIF